MFREFIRRANPKYEFYPHAETLIAVLQRVADGELRRVMFFMPPRHSKSETVSRLFSAYYVYRFPMRWAAITSYGAKLAYSLSRNARNHYVLGGGSLAGDAAAVEKWETGQGGGLWATGVGGSATGFGFHLGIIDDPLKDAEAASSEQVREKQRDWYRSTFSTREEPGGAIVLVMCMTGETPVLMADGTERPLRDVKVGDRVATYDNGKLATSTVQNHRSNGLDSVFRIKMICGKIVHANERHPFLVQEHGQLKWIRLKDLTTGHRIVTLRDRRANGKGRLASSTAATNLLAHGVIAPRTTTKRCGRTGIALRRLTLSHAAAHVLSIGTESLPQSTTRCLPRKRVNAPSVNSLQGITCERTGPGSCALTTVTKRTQSGAFCAMTVTSPWGTPRRRQLHSRLPNTSDFTTAQIESIEPAGVEEVFDIQIERTANFIANGLVSHNTRWHEADLAGWLLAEEEGEDETPERWHIVNLPAVAEEPRTFPPTCTVEPDRRAIGDALCEARYPLRRLRAIERRIGPYFYSALFRQWPQPLDGTMFGRSDFRIVAACPNTHWRVRYWDKAASVSAEAKYSAGVRLSIAEDGGIYVEHVVRGQWRTSDRRRVMVQTAQLDRATMGEVVTWIEQEPGSSGLDSVQDEIRLLMGYSVFADRPSGDKDTRLRPLSGQAQIGNLYLVQGEWNEAFIAELCAIPNGRYRDQADAASGAFNRLLEIIEAIPAAMIVHEEAVSISPI